MYETRRRGCCLVLRNWDADDRSASCPFLLAEFFCFQPGSIVASLEIRYSEHSLVSTEIIKFRVDGNMVLEGVPGENGTVRQKEYVKWPQPARSWAGA